MPALGKDGGNLEKIAFEAAVKRALDRNPTALQAAEEIRRFHALMEQVRAASIPTLAGSATYVHLDGSRTTSGLALGPTGALSTVTSVVQPQDSLNASVVLTAPLLQPKGWVQWGQAKDQIDVAKANAADVRRTVAVTTARAYLAVITERRLLETAATARDNARGHFEFTRAQLVGGVGNRLDEIRAAQELTSDEALLQNQEIALFRAREALGVLVAGDGALDADGASEIFSARSTPGATSYGAMPTLNDAMTEAEKHRPDVVARERAARAAARTVHDAYADYLPYLNLIAFPFYQNPPTVSAPQTGWEAELVLTLPLYDGGLRYGLEHEREAISNEAKLNVDATLRQARSDVRAAFEEMQRADVALDQALQSAAFAKKALELANLAYRAGATTNLEVIDAERQARDAETQAAVAEDSSRQARLDLLAASGRFP
jgi:outer membrane protein TolC